MDLKPPVNPAILPNGPGLTGLPLDPISSKPGFRDPVPRPSSKFGMEKPFGRKPFQRVRDLCPVVKSQNFLKTVVGLSVKIRAHPHFPHQS